MNSFSSDDTMPTFIQHMHAESDRFERLKEKPGHDISLSFHEYAEEMQQFVAPSHDSIASEVQEFEAFLRESGEILTAFVVPVFFAPQFGVPGKEARMALYQFDKDGFTTDGPYARSGYFMKVFPAEVAAGAVDMRELLQSKGEDEDVAELTAHRIKASALALRMQIWGE